MVFQAINLLIVTFTLQLIFICNRYDSVYNVEWLQTCCINMTQYKYPGSSTSCILRANLNPILFSDFCAFSTIQVLTLRDNSGEDVSTSFTDLLDHRPPDRVAPGCQAWEVYGQKQHWCPTGDCISTVPVHTTHSETVRTLKWCTATWRAGWQMGLVPWHRRSLQEEAESAVSWDATFYHHCPIVCWSGDMTNKLVR